MNARAWGQGWVVGRAWGIPVVISPGWVVAAVLLTVLVLPFAREAVPFDGAAAAWLLAAATVVLLFASVFLHEVAHALVARRFGIGVERITLSLLGGHTELGGHAPTPRASGLVALAGPATNLVIAVSAWALLGVLPDRGALAALVFAVAITNAFVVGLNLLPGLPLDGGFVLEAIVWSATGRRAAGTRAAAWIGRGVAVAIVVWGLWPVAGGTSLSQALWSFLIASFVWSGAGHALRSAALDTAVQALSLATLAGPAAPVGAGATVADLDRLAPGVVAVLVHDGVPIGHVDPVAAAAVPPEQRAGTSVQAVSTPLPPEARVAADLVGRPAIDAVKIASARSPVMAVLGPDGAVVGVLNATDVVRAIRAG